MLNKPEYKVKFIFLFRQVYGIFNFMLCPQNNCLLKFQVEFDEEGKVSGVTSEGETAKCKKVVCDPSYLINKVISALADDFNDFLNVI